MPANCPALRRVFVTGGARSGKSTFAEQLAAECGEPVLYLATATAGDAEMAERIRLHQARRPPGWRTLETPFADLPIELGDARTVLVEDLTLLLSNLMHAGRAGDAPAIVQQLLTVPAHVVLVSNEVGMGIVPATPLGRDFRDALGRLNQFAASLASEAYVLVSGLPLRLK